MSDYPKIIEPAIRKYPPPVRKGVEWATPPVPLMGLAGFNHQWTGMHQRPLFGTFVDKPTWVLVPDNWKSCYPPWQVEMLMKTYIETPWIREMRLVEVDF